MIPFKVSTICLILKAQLQRLIVESPDQLNSDWINRMKEQENTLIIVSYSLEENSINSLQPLLEQTDERPAMSGTCRVNSCATVSGIERNFQIYVWKPNRNINFRVTSQIGKNCRFKMRLRRILNQQSLISKMLPFRYPLRKRTIGIFRGRRGMWENLLLPVEHFKNRGGIRAVIPKHHPDHALVQHLLGISRDHSGS